MRSRVGLEDIVFLIQLGGTVGAACGLDGYGCEAIGAVLGCGSCFIQVFFIVFLEAVNGPDQEEHSDSHY